MSAYWQYLAEASLSLEIKCKDNFDIPGVGTVAKSERVNAGTLKACDGLLPSRLIESYFTVSELGPNKLSGLPVESLGAKGEQPFYTDLIGFLELVSTFRQLYSPAEHNHFITLTLGLLESYPEIGFRLAILKVCLPFEYKRTLFCCWLAIFESEESARTDNDFCDFCICTLCHDLGLLDVNPQFTSEDHDPRSSKDDVDGYYSHAEHSAKFLQGLKSISSKVLKGIEQHHETMDGTGYPHGKSGNQLVEYGQIIHLFDTLYSIYTKNYQPLGKALSDLSPIIEINAITHFGQCAIRLVALLNKAPRTETVFFKREEFNKIQTKTDEMANFIEKSIGLIQIFTSNVGFRHDDKVLFMLQNSFIHIALAYYKLRILHKQAIMVDALSTEGEYEMVAKALEDNFFTLREIIFHVNKFLYRLRLYRQINTNGKVSEHADETITALSGLTTKLVH